MTLAGDPDVARLIGRVCEVMETCARTDDSYRKNFVPSLTTHPIPFFGNIHTARVLTIGVNPSANEFVARHWPATLDARALTHRLLQYFQSPQGPHSWFSTWSEALALLGIDYARGEAAHLDLSPRATISMRSVPDPGLFLGMVSNDLRWMFEFLSECSRVQLLMVAGTVTKRWYVNQFLAAHGRQHGFELSPSPRPADRCVLYRSKHLGRCLPLFFSSVSPSASQRAHLLLENVRNRQDELRAHLN